MEQLKHFTHNHVLTLVHIQQNQNNKNTTDDEDVEEDRDDFVEKDRPSVKCNMCNEQIYSFHMCYYECKICDYSLHKFCAELPKTHQSHPLHPDHILTLSKRNQFYEPNPIYRFSNSYHDYQWKCVVCGLWHQDFFNYHCFICKFNMDIICASISKRTMDHPSHPHQLERMIRPMVSHCSACGYEHKGIFYHCTICTWFWIHLDCALLPTKLFIQKATNETFTHSHPLTLAYSFPYIDKKAKFFPRCRVCGTEFFYILWIYKCDRCYYYVHIDCATSKREPFMSILQHSSFGKTSKNFEDDAHPNLVHCPFPDVGINLLKHHFDIQKGLVFKGNNYEIPNQSSHPHPLILFGTQSSEKKLSLHDPMKKIQLLCDGCVKPITTMPFYKCSQYLHCGFVLHDWCAKLHSELRDYAGHPKHELLLLPNISSKFFGVFKCAICNLPSNGFAYGCTSCEYYIDVNCAFIPKEITHEAHPNHLLSKVNASAELSKTYCNACRYSMNIVPGFHCPSCSFYVHVHCAFSLPKMIRHKHDKHPLTLRYYPVENHSSEYYCEVCEDEFNPREWFYHCTTCAQSIHCACAPLILHCEKAVYSKYKRAVFQFLNVKFGGMIDLNGHPHPLTFVQGINGHGQCKKCKEDLQYNMIFKCSECDFALHYECASTFGN